MLDSPLVSLDEFGSGSKGRISSSDCWPPAATKPEPVVRQTAVKSRVHRAARARSVNTINL